MESYKQVLTVLYRAKTLKNKNKRTLINKTIWKHKQMN